MFSRNLANWDRVSRVVVGLGGALATAVFMEPSWLQGLFVASFAIFVATGFAARCPVCKIAGVSTHRP